MNQATAQTPSDARLGASDVVLDIQDMQTEFRIGQRWCPAIRNLSLTVRKNETVAVVGESGSGKSVTALSVLRLLPETGARISQGKILFNGVDLTTLSEDAMARIRGNDIAMIFQEPMTSLNPTMTVGDQIAEVVRIHRGLSWTDARREALRLLEEVRIPAAARRLHDYPHQFSGGMRQRVMIAIALACKPKLLLADEPTTALDVTIQAQVLALLNELRASYGMSILFITHNLGVVAQIADRVAVMYAGEIVEYADVNDLFAHPVHPYTEALLKAMPRVDQSVDHLEPIRGRVPSITQRVSGCLFAPRCDLRQPVCDHHPRLLPVPARMDQAPADQVNAAVDHLGRCFVRVPQELIPQELVMSEPAI